METTKKRPVHEVKLGRTRAAIWANQTKNGTMHSITVSRRYKDGDAWKDTTSFGKDEAPLAIAAFFLALVWISTEESKNDVDSNGDDEPNL